jgi:hypothetical protein
MTNHPKIRKAETVTKLKKHYLTIVLLGYGIWLALLLKTATPKLAIVFLSIIIQALPFVLIEVFGFCSLPNLSAADALIIGR